MSSGTARRARARVPRRSRSSGPRPLSSAARCRSPRPRATRASTPARRRRGSACDRRSSPRWRRDRRCDRDPVAAAPPRPPCPQVSEALALKDDLARAGVRVAGFLANQLLPPDSAHPTLVARGRAQAAQVVRLASRADDAFVAGVPWSGDELVGVDALAKLAGGGGGPTTVRDDLG